MYGILWWNRASTHLRLKRSHRVARIVSRTSFAWNDIIFREHKVWPMDGAVIFDSTRVHHHNTGICLRVSVHWEKYITWSNYWWRKGFSRIAVVVIGRAQRRSLNVKSTPYWSENRKLQSEVCTVFHLIALKLTALHYTWGCFSNTCCWGWRLHKVHTSCVMH
jgi:hypothetical protein